MLQPGDAMYGGSLPMPAETVQHADLYATHLSLGIQCVQRGDWLAARAHAEQAYALDPQQVDTFYLLGAISRVEGDLIRAVQWYRSILLMKPDCQVSQAQTVALLMTLGLQVKDSAPWTAIQYFQEASAVNPLDSQPWYNLGVTYAEVNKTEEALKAYARALQFNPNCAEAHNNMGVIYKSKDDLDSALRCYQAAVQANPRFTMALNNIGVVLVMIGRLQHALGYLSYAAEVDPAWADTYNNLGWLFWDQGDLEQALRMYEHCIALSPSSKNPPQNRLQALNYLPSVPIQLVFEAHVAWAERFSAEVGRAHTSWPNLEFLHAYQLKQLGRRLRIGYMSPDFFHHSVSYFAHCLLEHFDKEDFDVFLYCSTVREDDKTELFKSLVGPSRYRKVLHRPAAEAAEMIRADGIHILIDLAGHTANNRLDVMALKPAPVQFTWIGYNNTTGMGAIDYRVTDAVVDPPNTEQQFAEELVRLPGCFLCYTPAARIPDVRELAALQTGVVTFGSFSCLAKVSDPCVALWARVLHAVPGSRLLVKNKGFHSADVQSHFRLRFARLGIAEHRLLLHALTPSSFDHLDLYNQVDIALDTFPYTNTTTTCETLLMGVPLITLTGPTHGFRVGETLLTAVGLPELIARSEEEFLCKAALLATDLHTLASMRRTMRQRLLSSPLCDGLTYVRHHVEPMFRQKWNLLCDGRPPSMQQHRTEHPPHALAPCRFASPLTAAEPIAGSTAAKAALGFESRATLEASTTLPASSTNSEQAAIVDTSMTESAPRVTQRRHPAEPMVAGRVGTVPMPPPPQALHVQMHGQYGLDERQVVAPHLMSTAPPPPPHTCAMHNSTLPCSEQLPSRPAGAAAPSKHPTVRPSSPHMMQTPPSQAPVAQALRLTSKWQDFHNTSWTEVHSALQAQARVPARRRSAMWGMTRYN